MNLQLDSSLPTCVILCNVFIYSFIKQICIKHYNILLVHNEEYSGDLQRYPFIPTKLKG